MKNSLLFILAGVILLLVQPASAALQTKKILDVGCHIDGATCFVYVEGSISSSCTSNDGSFRWSSDSPNGKVVLSIFLAAQASGKSVSFGESGCFAGFPTFVYATVIEDS